MALRLVLRFSGRTVRIPLRQAELLLGSTPGSDIRVSHFTVSRRHATLRVREDHVEIEDLGSKNGTVVDGHRIEAPTLVGCGTAISFGGVEGAIEEVEDADLEVAFPLPAEQRPDTAEPRPDTPATSPMSAFSRFTLEFLPGLARSLAEGCSGQRMAAAVGAAIADTTQCLGIEILASGDRGVGVLFVAGQPHGSGGHVAEFPVAGSEWSIRVRFTGHLQERGYAPLIEACALLVSAALRGDASAVGLPVRAAPPPLPDPPTVEDAVRRLYADAARVAEGHISVLIRGESGTGKEVLARYIHAASPRSEQAFVPLNCAALPRDLLEAELFGIEKGAATGVDARPGRFELAHGGTLFLDEIADMALDTQARILRVLQEHEVYRLGGSEPRQADVRVVSATNRDLDAMLASGALRGDLYHRIADWDVTIPPLRLRRADIPNLAAHFLSREAARRGIHVAGISRGAMEILQTYRWPGNVRQLEREMARIVLFLESGELVETAHLQSRLREGARTGPGSSLQEQLDDAERRAILAALDAAAGDTSAASRALSIGRSTLYRRMKALGIGPAQGPQ